MSMTRAILVHRFSRPRSRREPVANWDIILRECSLPRANCWRAQDDVPTLLTACCTAEGLDQAHQADYLSPGEQILTQNPKTKLHFEVLDWQDTPLGPLYLRRRELLSRPGTVLTEVVLDHQLLMSSLHTESERALVTEALAWHTTGDPLTVLVGGLGLGYTAHEALAARTVRSVTVIERLSQVIRWFKDGLLPLSAALTSDARLTVREGDVYSMLLGPPGDRYDLVLIDVDHSPREPLDPRSRPFYQAEGLRHVQEHLRPGGVLGVWSAGDDDAFAAELEAVFSDVARRRIRWKNLQLEPPEEIEDIVFLARNVDARERAASSGRIPPVT
jgi:spermidine synthase